jgi:hypothetical protein
MNEMCGMQQHGWAWHLILLLAGQLLLYMFGGGGTLPPGHSQTTRPKGEVHLDLAEACCFILSTWTWPRPAASF